MQRINRYISQAINYFSMVSIIPLLNRARTCVNIFRFCGIQNVFGACSIQRAVYTQLDNVPSMLQHGYRSLGNCIDTTIRWHRQHRLCLVCCHFVRWVQRAFIFLCRSVRFGLQMLKQCLLRLLVDRIC